MTSRTSPPQDSINTPVTTTQKEVANPKGAPPPPAGQRVLADCKFHVRPSEYLEVQVQLEGTTTGDQSRDKKSAILAVFWTTKDNLLIPWDARNFSHSDTYGDFVYIGTEWGAPIQSATLNLRAPKTASFLTVRIMPFSNPSLQLFRLSLIRPKE